MPLMGRNKRWRGDERCIGEQLPQSSEDFKYTCWEVIGEALHEWHKLDAKIEELFKNCDPFPDKVMRVCRMVGKVRRLAQPTVIFCSPCKKSRKEQRRRLKEARFFAQEFSGFGTADYPHDPNAIHMAPAAEQLQSTIAPEGVTLWYHRTTHTAFVIYRKAWDIRRATVGGCIQISRTCYAVTAAHVFGREPLFKSWTEPVAPSEFSIDQSEDGDSLVSSNSVEPSTADVVITSTGSRSSTPMDSSDHSSSGIQSQEMDWQDEPKVAVDNVAYEAAIDVDSLPLDECEQVHGPIKLSSVLILAEQLDCAAFAVPGDVINKRGWKIPITLNDFVDSRMEKSSYSVTRAINLMSFNGVICTGRLGAGSVSMSLPYAPYQQELWMIRCASYSGPPMGGCGSWAIDRSTGKLYGHLVAGDRRAGVYYIVPAKDILKHIRRTEFAASRLEKTIETSLAMGVEVGSDRDSEIDPDLRRPLGMSALPSKAGDSAMNLSHARHLGLESNPSEHPSHMLTSEAADTQRLQHVGAWTESAAGAAFSGSHSSEPSLTLGEGGLLTLEQAWSIYQYEPMHNDVESAPFPLAERDTPRRSSSLSSAQPVSRPLAVLHQSGVAKGWLYPPEAPQPTENSPTIDDLALSIRSEHNSLIFSEWPHSASQLGIAEGLPYHPGYPRQTEDFHRADRSTFSGGQDQSSSILTGWQGSSVPGLGFTQTDASSIIPSEDDGGSKLSLPLRELSDHVLKSPSSPSNSFPLPIKPLVIRMALSSSYVRDFLDSAYIRGCREFDSTKIVAAKSSKSEVGHHAGKYACTWNCGRTFSSKYQWVRHEELRIPSMVYVCCACLNAGEARPFITSRRDMIRAHLKTSRHRHRYETAATLDALIDESKIDGIRCPEVRCGFGDYQFSNHKDRLDHLEDHFLGRNGVRLEVDAQSYIRSVPGQWDKRRCSDLAKDRLDASTSKAESNDDMIMD